MRYKAVVRVVVILFVASIWFSRPVLAAEDFAEPENVEELVADEPIVESGSSVEAEFYNRFRGSLVYLGRIQLNDELGGELSVTARTLAVRYSDKVTVTYTIEKYKASTRTWHYYDSQSLTNSNDSLAVVYAEYRDCPKGQYRLKGVHTVEHGGKKETKTSSTGILDTAAPL